jgi:uncharacterized protein YbjT (DUF2867 family)
VQKEDAPWYSAGQDRSWKHAFQSKADLVSRIRQQKVLGRYDRALKTRGERMILLIGATGTIGSAVARGLAEKQVRFRVLARDPDAAHKALGVGGDFVKGDLFDSESLARAMSGVEKVFLVTPFHLRQIEMKAAAIEAAKEAGVKHIVMSTGIGAGPNAFVEIGRWHGVNQEQVKASGMAYTFLQPTFFMQNMLMAADTSREAGVFYLPLGDSAVAWVDARDIADVGVAALIDQSLENKELPITGGEALTCAALAGILSDVLGREIKFVDVPLQAAKEAMIGAGMPEKLADVMNELYALGPAGHLAHVSPTVREVTGHPPRSFRQFAEDYAGAFGRR